MNPENPPNQLLRTLSPEVAKGEWRWRNHLRREDIDWLDDHRIQSQTGFPSTGYVAMALEAAVIIAGGRNLGLIEICDFAIDQAISMTDDRASVETLFKIESMSSEGETTSGVFTCYASFGGALRRCAYGKLIVSFGDQDTALLPPRSSQSQGMASISADKFYSYLSEVGYGYTDLFWGITSLDRRKDTASGLMINVFQVDAKSTLFHYSYIQP